MASAHTVWLQQLRSTICKMTETLAALADTSLPNPSLNAQLPRLQTLHQTLRRICESPNPQHEDVDASTRTAHALLTASFAGFLTVVVPQLAKLGTRLNSARNTRKADAMLDFGPISMPASNSSSGGGGGSGSSMGTAEEACFRELWICFASSFYAVTTVDRKLLNLWSEDNFQMYASLYPAYHTLLTWLLDFTRSPTWLAMRPQHGLHVRNSPLLLILHQLTNFLSTLATRPLSVLLKHLALLPPNSIPLLCCIVSEQLNGVRPIVPPASITSGTSATCFPGRLLPDFHSLVVFLPQFLHLMCVFISNLACQDSSRARVASRDFFPFLTAPAVLHMLKVILILQGESSQPPPGPPVVALTATKALDVLLAKNARLATARPPICLSLSERPGNRDRSGLPLHMEPRLSRAVLETDVRLLRALGKMMEGDVRMAVASYGVQIRILQCWMYFGNQYPVLDGAVSKMMASAEELAKQCALHTLQSMLHMQRERLTKQRWGKQQQQQGQKHSRAQRQQREHNQGQHWDTQDNAVRMRDINPIDLGGDFVKQLWNTMTLTAHFQIRSPGPKPTAHTTGERQYM